MIATSNVNGVAVGEKGKNGALSFAMNDITELF